MGITGLIPFLEKASSKVNLKDLRGSTVAVDTYCWLHKGVYTCAEKLVRGEETDLYIKYCLKYVQMLLSCDIKPILVFDGRHLPAKALTEQRRRESRQQSKKRAAELLRLGKTDEAHSHMRRCVDVTHEMALRLMKECRLRNVDCIVAPYEADAQMAWLNKVNLAQYIITEDSDLTLFGARKIIFKLDLCGNGLLVESDKLYLAMGCRQEKYTFEKFRRMCILSGCDYLDSLPGIGLAKACKFFLLTEEDNMWLALKKIPQYLKMRKLEVTDEYIESFLKAEATFKHMYIYNPFKRCMERLYDFTEFQTEERYCSNAGTILDDEEKALHLAVGNLNPFTLKQLDTWHPDRAFGMQQATDITIKRAKHKSIWQANYTNHARTEKVQKSVSALFFKQVDFNSKSIEQEIAANLQAEAAKPEESEIFSMYKYGATQDDHSNRTPQKIKRKRSEEETPPTSPAPTRTRHNPFAKILHNNAEECLEKSPKICENASLLRVLSPKKTPEDIKRQYTRITSLKRSMFINDTEKVQVKSRFFATNLNQSVKSAIKHIVAATTSQDLSAEIVQIENEALTKQEQQSQLYDSPSPRKSFTNRNEGITLSHADSGIESIVSDLLYQTDILQDGSMPNTMEKIETPIKMEVKEEIDTDFVVVSDDSCQSSASVSTQSSNTKSFGKFVAKTKTLGRLGLTKTKIKNTVKSAKISNSQNNTPSTTAQTRLSMFGFQKRTTLK